MGRVTHRRTVLRLDAGIALERRDTLAAEEPLEIRIGGRQVAVTMRTPGADFDLVAGFCWTEGLVRAPEHLLGMRYCAGDDGSGANTYNVIDVDLAADAPAVEVGRNFYTTSSCGVCGKASIDAVRVQSVFDVGADDVRVAPTVLSSLPGLLRDAQEVFDRTGGLHAAGLFGTDGELLALREDVGRHNATDKVIGWALREGQLPLGGRILLVSGRASFELVQKACLAGIPVLAAVSAPSSLAVDFAESVGMTLVGFLRGASMNVYTGAARVEAGARV